MFLAFIYLTDVHLNVLEPLKLSINIFKPNHKEANMAAPVPFKISVSNELLEFINQRVETARIPPGLDLPEEDAWSFGVPPETISHLKDYWIKKYDWRAIEAKINGHLKMFTLPISDAGEELTMHFVHHRSEREGAIPLLFQHGWPGNFLEVIA